MNAMNLIDVITLGVVEGLTEFLPVSSTGHMILTATLLKLENTEFLKSFEVAIQLGAILAIILLYFKRLFSGWAIYQRLFVAFLPTATIGFVMYKIIKKFLFSPVVVSISLIIGGILLIVLNRWIEDSTADYEDLEVMPLKNAFWIGMMQCLAMIPGVSRAGATIVGGILNGCNKRQATEFSFLLAIPTMLAATAYDLLKNAESIDQQGLIFLGIGGVTAFVSAWIAVKVFLSIVTRYGFAGFGYYRIFVGAAFLVLLYGLNLQLAT
jgi:undecaprenyl-diphosphatase